MIYICYIEHFLATNPKQICQHLMMHIFRNRRIELLTMWPPCVWWSCTERIKHILYVKFIQFCVIEAIKYDIAYILYSAHLRRTNYIADIRLIVYQIRSDQIGWVQFTCLSYRLLPSHVRELFIDIMALPSVIYSRSFS